MASEWEQVQQKLCEGGIHVVLAGRGVDALLGASVGGHVVAQVGGGDAGGAQVGA